MAKVASTSYPDPTQFDKKTDCHDDKATKEKPTWCIVDIAYVKTLTKPVTLAAIKAEPALKDMMRVKYIRLSVQPVSEKHFRHIIEEMT